MDADFISSKNATFTTFGPLVSTATPGAAKDAATMSYVSSMGGSWTTGSFIVHFNEMPMTANAVYVTNGTLVYFRMDGFLNFPGNDQILTINNVPSAMRTAQGTSSMFTMYGTSGSLQVFIYGTANDTASMTLHNSRGAAGVFSNGLWHFIYPQTAVYSKL